MLTDVFVNRYEETLIWEVFGERERRFMVQAAKIITEQLFPARIDSPEIDEGEEALERIHNNISMEIGVDPLTPTRTITGKIIPIHERTHNFLTQEFNSKTYSVDTFIKNRISFVELAFRENSIIVGNAKASLPDKISILRDTSSPNFVGAAYRLMGETEDSFHGEIVRIEKYFLGNIEEINTRFRQARFPLVYHNGFIQFSNEPLIAKNVEAPFWELVSNPKWENVENDMLEAIDRRDNQRRDAALAAAKALESVIKIISDDKGRTVGTEKGAASYIDNLIRDTNGRFIEVWEGNVLKSFFTEVRNKLGHGSGGQPIPQFTPQQDSWAIETCMSWIKSLITRM